MTTFTKFTLAILLAAATPALAQEDAPGPGAGDGQAAADQPAVGDATAEDSQEKIILEEPAATIDEALERLSEKKSAATEALAAARQAFDDRMAAAIQQTVNDLEAIARRAVADGKLADAAKAMEEILRLDPENKTALEFFMTIGRLDVVQERSRKPSKDARRVWRPNGSRVPRFVKQTDGSWIEIRSSGEKKVWSEASSTEHTVELKRPDGQMLRIHRDHAYWTSTNGGWQSGGRGSWDSDN